MNKYSNQFPKSIDKDPLTTKQRADFILSNIESKMPKLFEYIINLENEKKNKRV